MYDPCYRCKCKLNKPTCQNFYSFYKFVLDKQIGHEINAARTDRVLKATRR